MSYTLRVTVDNSDPIESWEEAYEYIKTHPREFRPYRMKTLGEWREQMDKRGSAKRAILDRISDLGR